MGDNICENYGWSTFLVGFAYPLLIFGFLAAIAWVIIKYVAGLKNNPQVIAIIGLILPIISICLNIYFTRRRFVNVAKACMGI